MQQKLEEENRIPRTSRLNLLTSSEKSLLNLMWEIENLGADIRLTKVITLLSEAKGILGNYQDEQIYRGRK